MTKLNNGVNHDISVVEARAALNTILASDPFLKAPRMSRLLRFIVERSLCGLAQETSEYMIGIDVFERDKAIYSTNDDPIVRVQMGRLRRKLKDYYAHLADATDLEISIPVGAHMPEIRRRNVAAEQVELSPSFAVHPFKCISQHSDVDAFTQGLHAELVHQLFKTFGASVIACSARSFSDNEKRAAKRRPVCAKINHRIEGNIQIESEFVKTSIRLIDVASGSVAWSEQFNHKVLLCMTLQEELATSICTALKQFFCHK